MFTRRSHAALPNGFHANKDAGERARGAPVDPDAAAREDMIENQLRRRGVVMHSVLEAMRAIPRHLFLSHEYAGRAYDDEALPSIQGQTISQPFMVAMMTQELALKPGHRVLEIGTGTGYQTAILAWLVSAGESAHASNTPLAAPLGEICTIERIPALAEFARHRLAALGIHNVHFFVGDGSAGWPRELEPDGRKPLFDRIIVTAGAPEVPQPLLGQLRDGGLMIVPIGPSDSQMLMRIERRGDQLAQTELLSCRFVPLVGAHAWNDRPAQDANPRPLP